MFRRSLCHLSFSENEELSPRLVLAKVEGTGMYKKLIVHCLTRYMRLGWLPLLFFSSSIAVEEDGREGGG